MLLLLLSAAEKQEADRKQYKKTPSFIFGANLYVSVGKEGDTKLVKASRAAAVGDDLKFKTLERKGDAYSNISELHEDENIINRADEIANRLKNNFAMSSPEWARWTNKTAEYNATSLSQVL